MRRIEEKIAECVKCGSVFTWKTRRSDLCTRCRLERKREYERKYRESNKEKLRSYLKNYRETYEVKRPVGYKEEHARAERERYRTDPEYRARKHAAARAWHKRKKKEDAQYAAKCRGYTRGYLRDWRKKNPEKAREHYRNWLKNNVKVKRTYEGKRRMQVQATRPKGFNQTEHIRSQIITQGNKCFYCGDDISGGFHLDHVVPLSRGGTHTPANLVLSCARCNLQKADKLYPSEWRVV